MVHYTQCGLVIEPDVGCAKQASSSEACQTAPEIVYITSFGNDFKGLSLKFFMKVGLKEALPTVAGEGCRKLSREWGCPCAESFISCEGHLAREPACLSQGCHSTEVLPKGGVGPRHHLWGGGRSPGSSCDRWRVTQPFWVPSLSLKRASPFKLSSQIRLHTRIFLFRVVT